MEDKRTDDQQRHSRQFLEMAFRSDRHGRLDHPDGYGKHAGACGDTVAFCLKLCAGRIQTISMVTEGCLNTNACANSVAHMSEGKTLDEAWQIAPEDVIAFLETLPEAETHCAELAVGAFYRALANCREMRRSPWKKAYRTAP